MTIQFVQKNLFKLHILAVVFLLGIYPTMSLAETFELRPGVIVDTERNVAYVMKPGASVDAISLKTGTAQWSTKEGAKPLALTKRGLVTQTEDAVSGQLAIVVLDVAKKGAVTQSNSIALPRQVLPTIDDSQTGAFVIFSRSSKGAVDFSWNYKAQKFTNALPQTGIEQETPFQKRSLNAKRTSDRLQGSFRMDLESNEISPLPRMTVRSLNRDSAKKQGSRAAIADDERIPGVDGLQYISSDGRHILNSEMVDNDNVFEKYVWRIYDRENKEKIGELRNHRPLATFFVKDNLIIFEEGETQQITAKATNTYPLRLRAVDLKTGKQSWFTPIRDTRYKGPVPQ